MLIIVFSDSAGIRNSFSAIRKSRSYSLQFYPPSEFRGRLKQSEKGAFIYVDISSWDPEEREGILKTLSRYRGRFCGIIDRSGAVKDPASLFHDGVSDYVGRAALKGGITPARMRRVASFCSGYDKPDAVSIKHAKSVPTSAVGARKREQLLSGKDWKKIRDGQEYTFWFMYFGLDHPEALKDTLSDSQYNTAIQGFRSFMERMVAQAEGRLWIWDEFGGLVLFPFDGRGFEPVITCYRLVLSRRIYGIEALSFYVPLSYHIALDIGNIIYRCRGNTGTIVSGAINDIFNLGKKFVKPGNFCITERVLQYVPEGLKKRFLPTDQFQGCRIMRMRLPL